MIEDLVVELRWARQVEIPLATQHAFLDQVRGLEI